ncbi:MAG: hypothetical protein H5T68_09925 [Chloroflexi bacterium]|jgi:hypothetical protein|nr:hypothetical protein [Chloroflexota bacterium]
MNEQELEQFLATITPERIRQLVLELEPQQPKADRGTVPLWQILEELTKDLPITEAADQSPVEMRLRKAIIDAVGQIEGLTFVEGDG